MKIKKFSEFNEAISGTFDIEFTGPSYPRTELRNTISSKDTQIIFCDLNSKFYTLYEYIDLLSEYTKNGGEEDLSEFNKTNLDKLIFEISKM